MIIAFIIISIIAAAAIAVIIIDRRRLTARIVASEADSAALRSELSVIARERQVMRSAGDEFMSYLAELLTSATAVIAENDALRKRMNRRLKDGDIDGLAAILKDTETTREQYRIIHEAMDKAIVRIFPDIAEGGTLPLATRQRIQALNRLGIAKSGDVAAILNLSIRTVYNNRTS